MPLPLGTRLGPYEVEAELGRGGMGEVYRARDIRLRRAVALKILTGTFALDPQFRERFDREARAISALNHPNICTLFDIGNQDDLQFLVMELLDGETLAARVSRGPLQHADVLAIAIQIGSALDTAHRAGIVHRDLKPGNIILTRAGTGSAGSPQAKLLDFGLARPVSNADGADTTQAALTTRGDLIGSLPYMAPEQLEGREVDARTDIWAFGCLLYEMVAGRRPFTALSDARVISAILTTEPPPLQSSPLGRLIRKCLAKDPDRRWQTAADLTDELRWIGGQSVGSSASAPADATVPGRVSRWRHVPALAAVGIAVASLGIAAGYYLRPAPEVPLTRFSITPPFRTAWGNGLAISPDGRRVAFVAAAEGKSSIWIHQFDKTDARALDGTNGAEIQVFWSPDGASLGFFADGSLKTIPADGGPVRTLAAAPLPGGGTWNRDDVIVFSPDVNRGLSRVRADASGVASLTTLDAVDGENGHRAPAFLPDGRHLLYRSNRGVYATSLEDPGRRVRVLEDASSSVQFARDHLLFVRKGSLWAQPFDLNAMAVSGEATMIGDGVDQIARQAQYEFSASETGMLVYRTVGLQPVRQFVWVDRSGRELSHLPMTGILDSPVVSPTGTRLAFSMESSGNRDIYVLDLDLEHPVPRRLSYDSGSDEYPAWSPDGSHIVFTRDQGRAGLFEVNADGTVAERILLPRDKDSSAMYAYGYTKDGRTLLVGRFRRGTNGGLFTLALEGEPRLVEFLDSPANELVHRLSPDNNWIAYISNQDGRNEIFVERYPSRGRKAQVSDGFGSGYRWRADGGELFYVGSGGQLTAVLMKDGDRTSSPTALFDHAMSLSFDVAKDGQSFLVNRPATGSDAKTVAVVMNWPALLKR